MEPNKEWAGECRILQSEDVAQFTVLYCEGHQVFC